MHEEDYRAHPKMMHRTGLKKAAIFLEGRNEGGIK